MFKRNGGTCMTYIKPAPTRIPTEPIGSIPRPIDLLRPLPCESTPEIMVQ
jgi:hypothetical protein